MNTTTTAAAWLDLITYHDRLTRQERGPDTLQVWSEWAHHFGYTMPDEAVRFASLNAARRAIIASGSHYFDADAVRFFRGKTHKIPGTGTAGLAAGRFWVESRQFVSAFDGTTEPREYQIAWTSACPGADRLSVEKLGAWHDLDSAATAALILAGAVEKVSP